MPKSNSFAKAFKLQSRYQNKEFKKGKVITKITIGHDQIERYRSYSYPIVIEMKEEFLDEMKNFLNKQYHGLHLIVNSQYGNPYDCWIDDFVKISSTLTSTGHGIRIFK